MQLIIILSQYQYAAKFNNNHYSMQHRTVKRNPEKLLNTKIMQKYVRYRLSLVSIQVPASW